MIDETLSRLSRELIAASDKLASEEFKARQAAFVELEKRQEALAVERLNLAISLEADEMAVVRAQEALQAHFAALATPAAPEPETPADDESITITHIPPIDMSLPHMLAASDDVEAEADRLRYKGFVEQAKDAPFGETVDVEQYFRPVFGQTEPDEFSSSRANGAYQED